MEELNEKESAFTFEDAFYKVTNTHLSHRIQSSSHSLSPGGTREKII
jgi:hypothetical protein